MHYRITVRHNEAVNLHLPSIIILLTVVLYEKNYFWEKYLIVPSSGR